jgi:hypothetical protein
MRVGEKICGQNKKQNTFFAGGLKKPVVYGIMDVKRG